MTVEYDTGDWNKKLSMFEVVELNYDDIEGWDLVDKKPCIVCINKIWVFGIDIQKEMLHWVDDNSKGYFYQYGFSTEGGTPIIRDGDKFSITLAFQKIEDAIAFKLRWM